MKNIRTWIQLYDRLGRQPLFKTKDQRIILKKNDKVIPLHLVYNEQGSEWWPEEDKMMMKLWIDDIRPAPDGFIWCKSVNQAKAAINAYENQHSYDNILIDLDHDAGDYFNDGGDYFKILDWLEEENIVDAGYFFKIHSQNPVGVMKMKNIIYHNDWKLVL